MKYEVITTRGNYSVIKRKDDLSEYAVVHGLDTENNCWNHTVVYYNIGFNGDESDCLSKCLEILNIKTKENYISRYRLEELSTKFKDKIIEEDEYHMEFFEEECELLPSEYEWFGIESEE